MELLLMILLNVFGISEESFQKLEQNEQTELIRKTQSNSGDGWILIERE